MGGRGSFSYSGNNTNNKAGDPLGAYAVAALNAGTAGGTSTSAAIDRFREMMMNQKHEYSAYVDDNGYVHALASTGKEGSTGVASFSNLANEKGKFTIVHNHPHGGSDGRIWGGPFSEADLSYAAYAHTVSNGRVNRIVATSNEGTYHATVTKSVKQSSVSKAAAKAEKSVKDKKFQSEKGMWRAVNNAYTREFGKIGIDIKFTPDKKKSKKLVTEKIGNY